MIAAVVGFTTALILAVATFFICRLVHRDAYDRGFEDGWRESLIEDDTEDAEWEGRAYVHLPPPAKKRLVH